MGLGFDDFVRGVGDDGMHDTTLPAPHVEVVYRLKAGAVQAASKGGEGVEIDHALTKVSEDFIGTGHELTKRYDDAARDRVPNPLASPTTVEGVLMDGEGAARLEELQQPPQAGIGI